MDSRRLTVIIMAVLTLILGVIAVVIGIQLQDSQAPDDQFVAGSGTTTGPATTTTTGTTTGVTGTACGATCSAVAISPDVWQYNCTGDVEWHVMSGHQCTQAGLSTCNPGDPGWEPTLWDTQSWGSGSQTLPTPYGKCGTIQFDIGVRDGACEEVIFGQVASFDSSCSGTTTGSATTTSPTTTTGPTTSSTTTTGPTTTGSTNTTTTSDILADCGESCVSTADCVSGYTCDAGICKLPQCVTPGACSDGACIPIGCGNGTIDPGEECGEPGLSCGIGETCNVASCICAGNECGGSCIDDSECPVGHSCNSDTCELNECVADPNSCEGDGCNFLACGSACTFGVSNCPAGHGCAGGTCKLEACITDPSSCSADSCVHIPQTALISDEVDRILIAVVMMLFGVYLFRYQLVDRLSKNFNLVLLDEREAWVQIDKGTKADKLIDKIRKDKN